MLPAFGSFSFLGGSIRTGSADGWTEEILKLDPIAGWSRRKGFGGQRGSRLLPWGGTAF